MLFTPGNSRIVGPAILLPGGIRFNTEAIHPAADQVFHSQLLFPTSLFIDG